MNTATVNVVANVAGQTVPVQLARSNDGCGLWTPAPAAGKAGSLTTRTDNDTGVATLGEGHGIITGDKVDVFWAGGRRYHMSATVSGNAVTVDGGGGGNLPAQDTALVVCKTLVVNAAFDPDDMIVLLASTVRRASIVFVDSGGAALLALDLAAGGCCLWWTDSGISRPMTGNAVAAVWIGNGDATAAGDLFIATVYDATP
jgi:hypothetical protein